MDKQWIKVINKADSKSYLSQGAVGVRVADFALCE